MRLLLGVIVLTASAGLAMAQGRAVIPVAPAEITTTIPPSITGPEAAPPKQVPPNSALPRARAEQTDPASTAKRRPQIQTTTPPSITRPDIPNVNPPNSRALCYERQVFNPNTFEYEWQQLCD